ncbi:MAG: ABC transporter permease subunit [Pirellulales bacterium]
MNRGVMLKAAIETWPSTLLCGLLLFAAEAALAYVIPTFQGELSESLSQMRFLQNFVGAMLGVRVANQLGPDAFAAFPWVHPVVLAIVWAHALVCCTRTPAGEVDRGTADMTMTLPVTRFDILLSESIVWMVAGAIVLAMGLAGNLFGSQYVTNAEVPPLDRTLRVLVNLYFTYLAVGGFSWLVSAGSNRRGPAMTVVFVALLASFLINFLAQFWDPADRISWLSVLYYYRPMFILRDGVLPWSDLAALGGTFAVLWGAAAVVFGRRDVVTT